MSASVYSHAVRVLICEHCGAPLQAQLTGGNTECTYCGATTQLVQRDESRDLAEAAEAQQSAVSEAERVQQLRAQDEQSLAPPESLQPLLRGRELDPTQLELAQSEWKSARRRLLGGGGFAASERLFYLTVLIAPLLEDRHERPLLESAIELLPDPCHRQVLRCRMAQKATLAGDLEAAEGWLRPCNPRPTDIRMDTAYRIATACLATARQDFNGVLNQLGDRVGDVPIADEREDEATLFRINAIEQLEGKQQAESQLKELLSRSIHRLHAYTRAAEANAPLRLCTQSWPPVHRLAHEVIEHELRHRNTDTGCLKGLTGLAAILLIPAIILIATTASGAGADYGIIGTNLGVFGLIAGFGALAMFRSYRKAKRLQQTGQYTHAYVLGATTKVETSKDSSKTYQMIDVQIDGTIPATYKWESSEPPALGVYPCLYDPSAPDQHFHLRLTGLSL